MMFHFRSRILASLLALAFCLTFVASAAAQSTTSGGIGGTVSDPQKAVVPSAMVTIRNTGTNEEQSATTDSGGGFRFTNLRPGTYSISAGAAGFAPLKRDGVMVEVGRVTPLELSLAISGRAETVEVTGEAPAVNTTQHDFSSNVNQTAITELPVQGRRWSNFVLLTPGATPDGNFGLISFRGISGLLNNNTVDGGDNNNAYWSEESGRTRISYVQSQASVREFQVNTSNFSAEYGRSAGGVVNAVTKSGTNNLHGSAFYYIRDSELSARNAFSFLPVLVGGVSQTVAIKTDDRRQQWGGSLGGALIKDKLFYFFTYDQQKRTFPGLAVPDSPAFFNPITVSAPASCTAAGLTAGQVLACRGVTQAQVNAGLAFLQSISGQVQRSGDELIVFPKIDWRIRPSHNLALSYNRMRWDSPAGIQTQPVVNRAATSFGDDFVKSDSGIARLSSTITPRILNELRFKYGRDFLFQNSQNPLPNEPTTGVGGRPPDTSIFSPGFFRFGKPEFLERKALPDERRIQVADTVSLSRGKHLFKFGLDYNHVNDLVNQLRNESGSYSFSTIQDWLTDFAGRTCPTNPATLPRTPCASSFSQGFGPTAFEYNTNDYNFFVQDEWRIHPRLTLNLGVRYEYQQLPDPQLPNPLLPQTSKFPSDSDDVGPRIGFAWDPWGDGKTAVRGGYGIYYGRTTNLVIQNAITNTGLAQAQLQFRLTGAAEPRWPNVLSAPPTSGASLPDVAEFSPSMANPLIHQTDIVFEHEIARDTVASVSYLVSLGRTLPIFIDRNLNPPSSRIIYTVVGGDLKGQRFTLPLWTGPRPNPNFGAITEISSRVDSRYDALVAQLNRRMSKGLQLMVNHTWAHAIDLGQQFDVFTNNSPLNPFDLSLEQGSSNFDIRHRFVLSAVWAPEEMFGRISSPVLHAILGDWQVGSIIQLQTGRPFSAGASGNAPLTACSATVTTNCRTGAGLMGDSSTGGTSLGTSFSGTFVRAPFLPRNGFNFLPIKNVDLRISRSFRVAEGKRLEFLAEAFNLINRVNVTNVRDQMFTVGGTAAVPTLTFDSRFQAPIAAGNTLYLSRQIQVAARFTF